MTFDCTLIDPTPAQRDAALAEAGEAANARFRTKLVTWPPPDFADFLAQLAGTAEGMRGWHGGTKPNYWEGRSQVATAWWTDRLGRKHLRVLGGAGKTLCHRMLFQVPRLGGERLSTLEQVYPRHTARCARGGQVYLLGLCDCGAVGTPEALGWTGERCGPCHDRPAAGEAAPLPLSFAFSELPFIAAHLGCGLVAFAPDGRTVALAQDGVWLRDLETGAMEQLPLSRDRRRRHCLGYADGGRRLVLAVDGEVLIWDVPRRQADRWPLPGSTALDAALSPDGATLAFGTPLAVRARDKGRVRVCSAADGAVRRELATGPGALSGLEFSRDGRLLATANFEGPLRLWDVRSGRLLRELADDLHPSTLTFSADNALLAGVSLLKKELRLWDVAGGKALPAPPTPEQPHSSSCLAFAPEGRVLVYGHEHGRLSLWDLAAGSERLDLQWGEGNPLCTAWSPDGRWLAVGDGSVVLGGRLRLWPWPALRALLAQSEEAPG
jgi:WD40 repeat protein